MRRAVSSGCSAFSFSCSCSVVLHVPDGLDVLEADLVANRPQTPEGHRLYQWALQRQGVRVRKCLHAVQINEFQSLRESVAVHPGSSSYREYQGAF